MKMRSRDMNTQQIINVWCGRASVIAIGCLCVWKPGIVSFVLGIYGAMLP